jgi:hypothetical protein
MTESRSISVAVSAMVWVDFGAVYGTSVIPADVGSCVTTGGAKKRCAGVRGGGCARAGCEGARGHGAAWARTKRPF